MLTKARKAGLAALLLVLTIAGAWYGVTRRGGEALTGTFIGRSGDLACLVVRTADSIGDGVATVRTADDSRRDALYRARVRRTEVGTFLLALGNQESPTGAAVAVRRGDTLTGSWLPGTAYRSRPIRLVRAEPGESCPGLAMAGR